MFRRTTIAVLTCSLLAAGGVYFWNPYGAPDWGVMGRLMGEHYYRVPGKGMEPELPSGSIVLLCFDRYRKKPAVPGDLVLFRVPGESFLYLKRVAAVGGETIEIRDTVVIVNGSTVRTWFKTSEGPAPVTDYSRTMAPITVQPGYFFALGDNLNQSIDSRRVGPVRLSAIFGGPCTS